MDNFRSRRIGTYYPYQPSTISEVTVVPLFEVEPPCRSDGVPAFRKYKLVPVMLAFASPECDLPPIEVKPIANSAYRYQVCNGYHRYYASVAVGYIDIPALVVIMDENGL